MDAIVSVTRGWAIGKNGALLVRNRDDMRRFVALTTGGTVLMGRKTYESFPKGPLKGRRNVILTRDRDYEPPHTREPLPEGTSVVLVHSIEEALAATSHDTKVWLIGGASVYRALLPLCERCYVTKNDVDAPNADAYFPDLDENHGWEVESLDRGGTTSAGIPFEFVTYRRVAAQG